MHACPVKGCTTQAKDGHLMCLRHWRRVPRILQAAVWETFRWYSRAASKAAQPGMSDEEGLSSEHELFTARAAYLKASNGAITAVEAKEAA